MKIEDFHKTTVAQLEGFLSVENKVGKANLELIDARKEVVAGELLVNAVSKGIQEITEVLESAQKKLFSDLEDKTKQINLKVEEVELFMAKMMNSPTLNPELREICREISRLRFEQNKKEAVKVLVKAHAFLDRSNLGTAVNDSKFEASVSELKQFNEMNGKLAALFKSQEFEMVLSQLRDKIENMLIGNFNIEHKEEVIIKSRVVEVPVIKEVERIVEIPVYREVEVVVEKVVIKEVERIVEVPVFKQIECDNPNLDARPREQFVDLPKKSDKYIEVPVIKEVERIVETVIVKEVEKIVEVPIFVEKIIEVPIFVDKYIEVPVIKELERIVETVVVKEVEKEVDKLIYREKVIEVPVYKECEKVIEVARLKENFNTDTPNNSNLNKRFTSLVIEERAAEVTIICDNILSKTFNSQFQNDDKQLNESCISGSVNDSMISKFPSMSLPERERAYSLKAYYIKKGELKGNTFERFVSLGEFNDCHLISFGFQCSSCFVYSWITEKFLEFTTSLVVPAYHSVCRVPGGHFLSGGQDTNSKTIDRTYFCYYNSEEIKFEELEQLPEAKFNHSSIGFNNSVYIIGGHDSDTCWKYSIPERKYYKLPSLAEPRDRSSLIVLNNILYVINGFNNADTSFCCFFEKMSLVSEAEWEKIEFKKGYHNYLKKINSGILLKDNEIYILGGENSMKTVTKDVLKYEPEENKLEINRTVKLNHNSFVQNFWEFFEEQEFYGVSTKFDLIKVLL